MATARETIAQALRGEGPLGKASDDEPVFILRAQDCLAYEVIERWVIRASVLGVNKTKQNEARVAAEEMLQWPIRKVPD
jgi:hypothetical protein